MFDNQETEIKWCPD